MCLKCLNIIDSLFLSLNSSSIKICIFINCIQPVIFSISVYLSFPLSLSLSLHYWSLHGIQLFPPLSGHSAVVRYVSLSTSQYTHSPVSNITVHKLAYLRRQRLTSGLLTETVCDCLFVCLCICPSTHPFVHLSTKLSIHLFVCLIIKVIVLYKAGLCWCQQPRYCSVITICFLLNPYLAPDFHNTSITIQSVVRLSNKERNEKFIQCEKTTRQLCSFISLSRIPHSIMDLLKKSEWCTAV